MNEYGLLKYFEGYYGVKYTDILQAAMIEYLQECNSELYLTAILKVIMLRLPIGYNVIPCIAHIEDNIKEIEQTYNKLLEQNRLLLTENDNTEKATPEEAKGFIEQMRAIIEKGAAGAMKKPLNDFIENAIGIA